MSYLAAASHVSTVKYWEQKVSMINNLFRRNVCFGLLDISCVVNQSCFNENTRRPDGESASVSFRKTDHHQQNKKEQIHLVLKTGYRVSRHVLLFKRFIFRLNRWIKLSLLPVYLGQLFKTRKVTLVDAHMVGSSWP